jgi:DNA modification methylase
VRAYKTFLNDYTATALLVSDYVFSNIQSLAGNKIALIEHLYDMREKFADTIIWNKKSAAPAMARKVLNSQFEYIHVFSNEAKRTIGTRDFKGTLFNVIDMGSRKDKDLASVHRATFPVEFAEHFVNNFTESTCFDPFGGTGTTLIACEKINRNCYMMELDPKYCDVIIKRWKNFTGKQVVHVNGEVFDG